MAEQVDEHNIDEQLSAFADGELDAAQMTRVLEYLAVHRDALEVLRVHQKIRATASSVLKKLAPPVSPALRERIEKIAAEARPADNVPRTLKFPAAAVWWGGAAAAAAMIIVSFSAGRWLRVDQPKQTAFVSSETPPVVPVVIISQAEAIHADCSRLAAGLHNAPYPAELGGLADAVRGDLSRDVPYPNLEPMGFTYRGAGPCGSTLPGTIHLLYKARSPVSTHAVSVFVQMNHGQFSLDAGKLYSLEGARSPFPMLAWRTENVIYFLIADDAKTLEKARSLIASASALSLPAGR